MHMKIKISVTNVTILQKKNNSNYTAFVVRVLFRMVLCLIKVMGRFIYCKTIFSMNLIDKMAIIII